MSILDDSHTLTRYFFTAYERPDDLLLKQLQRAKATVEELITASLQDHQIAALVCLVADTQAEIVSSPSSSFEKSPLVSAVNKGMFQIAAGEFYTFCYTRGKLNPRAWQKRKAEHLLFLTGRLLF